MLESTGPAFRKYITRALASRAVEDQEREVAVADTLSSKWIQSSYNSWAYFPQELESNRREPQSQVLTELSNRRASITSGNPGQQEKLSRLHDIFQYRSSILSNGSSQGQTLSTTQRMGSEPWCPRRSAFFVRMATQSLLVACLSHVRSSMCLSHWPLSTWRLSWS